MLPLNSNGAQPRIDVILDIIYSNRDQREREPHSCDYAYYPGFIIPQIRDCPLLPVSSERAGVGRHADGHRRRGSSSILRHVLRSSLSRHRRDLFRPDGIPNRILQVRASPFAAASNVHQSLTVKIC